MSTSAIKNWISRGDFDKLEHVVLEGKGSRLLGEHSSDLRTRVFLKGIPNYLTKISQIHNAVERGSLSEVQRLVELEPKKKLVIAKDSNRTPLIHKAVYYDHPNILNWILDNYPETVEQKDREGRTALHYCAACRDPDTTWDRLIKSGCDSSICDKRSNPAAYYLQHSSELDLPDPAKMTGKKHRNKDPSKWINSLDFKPSNIRIWIHNRDIGKLQHVLWEGHGSKLRCETSNNVRVKRFLEAVPFIMVTIKDIHSSVIKNDLEGFQKKMDEPIPPIILCSKDSNGLNVLHKAAGLGYMEIAREILERYPLVANIPDNEGRTPLHYAAVCRDGGAMYDLLTEYGADENKSDNRQKNASFYKSRPSELDLTSLVMVPEAPRVSGTSYPRHWDWRIIDSALPARPRRTASNNSVAGDNPMTDGGSPGSNGPGNNNDDDSAFGSAESAKELTEEDAATPEIENAEDELNDNDEDESEAHHNEDDGEEGDEEEDETEQDDVDQENEHIGILIEEYNEESAENEDKPAEAENEENEAEGGDNAAEDEEKESAEPAGENGENESENVEQQEQEEPSNEEEQAEPANEEEQAEPENEEEQTEPANEEEQAEPANEEEQAEPGNEEKQAEPGNEEEQAEPGNEEEQAEPEEEEGEKGEEEPEADDNNNNSEEPQAEEPEEGGEEKDATEEGEQEGEGEEEKAEEGQEGDEEATADEEKDKETGESEGPMTEKQGEEGENEEEGPAETTAEDDENPKPSSADSGVAETPGDEEQTDEPADQEEEEEEEEGDGAEEAPTAEEPEAEEEQEGEEAAEKEEEPAAEEEEPNEEAKEEGGEEEGNEAEPEDGSGMAVDEETEQLVETGTMEQLAALVLTGEGSRLVGRRSNNPELQAFIDNVPTYMSKIRVVHKAAREGNLKDLQVYLDRRKFAVAKDPSSPHGATPLHVAVIFGHTPVVRYLAGRFPETVHALDLDGRTPLHYAAILADNGHYYNLLLHLGANPLVSDNFGHKADYYKQNRDDLSHKQLLRDFGAPESLADEMLVDKVPGGDTSSARRDVSEPETLASLERCFRLLTSGVGSTGSQGAAAAAATASNNRGSAGRRGSVPASGKSSSSGAASSSTAGTLLGRCLRRSVFEAIKHRVTCMDHNLFDVVWPALKKCSNAYASNSSLEAGIANVRARRLSASSLDDDFTGNVVAPDFESYKVFAELLDPLIRDLHNVTASGELPDQPTGRFFLEDEAAPASSGSQLELQIKLRMDLLESRDIDQSGRYVMAGLVECTRNLLGHQLPLTMRISELEETERELTGALIGPELAAVLAEGSSEDEPGTYYTLSELLDPFAEARARLAATGLLLPITETENSDERRLHGKHWPYGRGVFLAASGDLAVWVNVQDHLRVICCSSEQHPGQLGRAYARLGRVVGIFEQLFDFTFDPRLGYLGSRPCAIGNTLRFELIVKLAGLARKPDDLKQLCLVRGLRIHPTLRRDTVRLGNQQSLSIGELQTYQDFDLAVTNILVLEKENALNSSLKIATVIAKIFKRRRLSGSRSFRG